MLKTAPSLKDIESAAKRLEGHIFKTPVLESTRMNNQFKCRLLIKAENLQRTGSFKFRGAFNMIASLSDNDKMNGVVAFSSGNHARGVAAAAKILGINATVVMPADAPKIKIENTRQDGANIVLYNRADANRLEIAKKIAQETGGTLIPPFDAAEIMAGQATLGIEFIDQAKNINAELDYFLAPCSGGGLIGGNAIVFNELSKHTLIYCVEPEGFDDTARSLIAGERLTNKLGKRSFCDALLLEEPGRITFKTNKRLLTGGLVVNDAETAKAIKVAFEVYKIVIEPSGAIALAAILSGKINPEGKTIGIICTGGNIDADTFKDVLDGKFED